MAKSPSRVRDIFIQALFFAGLVAFLSFAAHNVSTQLAARGISSGFDFLSHQAGFGIAFHLLPYSETSTVFQVFLVGAVNTLFISVVSIVLASVIGLIIALFRLSPLPVLRAVGTFYVETLRNVPLLLQFFVWYFASFVSFLCPLRATVCGDGCF